MVRGRDLGSYALSVHKVGSIYVKRGFQPGSAGFRNFRLIFPQVDRFLRGFKKKVWRKNQNFNIFSNFWKKIRNFQNLKSIWLIFLYISFTNIKGNQANQRFLKILEILTNIFCSSLPKISKIYYFSPNFFFQVELFLWIYRFPAFADHSSKTKAFSPF